MTNRVDTDHHSHAMLQISVSFYKAFKVRITEREIMCKGIIIKSNESHIFYSNQDTQIILLIDASSVIAEQIMEKYLKGQAYYIMDEKTIDLVRDLLYQYYPIVEKKAYLEFFLKFLQTINIDIQKDMSMDERIVSLIRQIKNCLGTKHSMDDMAKNYFLSQSRLSHLFKKETGMRLSSYIVLHKLQKAMFYILNGKSITEAALEAGFDSPSHFAAVCKKTLGMSARELEKDSVFLKVSTY
ncbi:helix-turn-helix transcriptional regulator [Cellulosilyticum sp. I15G10I2]|uniref:helix-turn-helix transcriptional regulator n=1 Tax=Cellulosilyticum sp. I15G10I2 TaxID=1892843 RepID=UPI001A9A68CC|nr:response regulator transcription factor [Cellulosilyticum sp. I15G10I2]